ncbi:MAG: glycosyltransferase family 4 protein [Actinomycetota bacterium]
MTSHRTSVLVVSPPSEVWGAQLYLLEQVEALAERGVDLALGTPAGSPFAEAWVERGFALEDLRLELHDGLRQQDTTARPGPRSALRSAFGVGRGVGVVRSAAAGHDVLHSFALRSHMEVAVAGRLSRTPVALDLVNIVRPGLGRRVLQQAANLATLTVANSAASAAVLKPKTRVTVIHPGVDLDRFTRGPADPALRAELSGGVDRPLVAILGRIDVRKGVQTLVEAMALAGGPAADARLIVVGEAGTGPAEFAEKLKVDAAARLGDRVLFAGRRSDIPEILRSVDVLVNASVAEPFGLTVLEAQAVGTPVVATRAGGVVEFVEDEVTGLLVPPTDAPAMARAIERVLGDPALVEQMTEKAYANANPARGLAAQYDEIADMYRAVAAGRVPDGSRHG